MHQTIIEILMSTGIPAMQVPEGDLHCECELSIFSLTSNHVTLVLVVPEHHNIIEILMTTGIHEKSTIYVSVRPIKLNFRPMAAL